MNGRRARKIRKLARSLAEQSRPIDSEQLVQVTEWLYRRLLAHWEWMDHRQRGRYARD